MGGSVGFLRSSKLSAGRADGSGSLVEILARGEAVCGEDRFTRKLLLG